MECLCFDSNNLSLALKLKEIFWSEAPYFVVFCVEIPSRDSASVCRASARHPHANAVYASSGCLQGSGLFRETRLVLTTIALRLWRHILSHSKTVKRFVCWESKCDCYLRLQHPYFLPVYNLQFDGGDCVIFRRFRYFSIYCAHYDGCVDWVPGPSDFFGGISAEYRFCIIPLRLILCLLLVERLLLFTVRLRAILRNVADTVGRRLCVYQGGSNGRQHTSDRACVWCTYIDSFT